jgi:hypothetical protein
MKIILFILFVIISYSCADQVQNKESNTTFIDDTHKNISDKIVDYSNIADNFLYNILYTDDNPFDVFYKTNTFIDATSKSFVSFKFSYNFQSLYTENFSFYANARIPLSRTQKRFNLFIEGVDEDNIKTLIDPTQESTPPDIGLNYFVPKFFYITSKYSIGMNGIKVFARARYHMEFKTNYITIQPVQKFELSTTDQFRESSLLYFDSNKLEDALLRLVLYRRTGSTLTGMDYGTVLSYFKKINDKTAINISQSLSGNSKYPIPNKGIYNYTTSFNFRRNFLKKWLFYELVPSVNYHVENDYHPNYSFRTSLEFYFGNF